MADGSVITTRYKSSSSVYDVRGSALNGDYVVATIELNPYVAMVMYSILSSKFAIYSFSSGFLYE